MSNKGSTIISVGIDDREILDSIDNTTKLIEANTSKIATSFDSMAKSIENSFKNLADKTKNLGSNIGNNISADATKKIEELEKKIEQLQKNSGNSKNIKLSKFYKEGIREDSFSDEDYANMRIGILQKALAYSKQISKRYEVDTDELEQQARIQQTINDLLKRGKMTTDQWEDYEKKKTMISQREAEKRAKIDAEIRNRYSSMDLDDLLKSNANSINERSQKIRALKKIQADLSTTDADYAKKISAVNQEINKLNKANKEAVSTGVELNNKTNKLAESFKNLGRRVIFYFSLGMLSNLAKSLIHITGQYEMIRTTLGAILNDTIKAAQIFNTIKIQAIESPFQIGDLATSAKMLAAYGYEANELVDVTKRISDISAGLGVEVSRIIYNLGQIKAKGVLDARDLRDFGNAGLNILGSLSDMYSKLEGRLVSTGEVFDRISARMVNYNDVMQVMNKYTNQGGMFFNMQAKMAKTLEGRISNLKDVWNNSLADIGNGGRGFINNYVDVVYFLAENFRGIIRLLGILTLSFASYQVVVTATAIKTNTLAEATNKLSKIFVSIGKTSKAGWAGLIAGALIGIGAAIFSAIRNANRLKRELNELATSSVNSLDNTLHRFEQLSKIINTAATNSRKYQDAINELNNVYGQYLPNLLTEQNAVDELAKSYDNVTEAIQRAAKVRFIDEGMLKISEEYDSKRSKKITKLLNKLEGYGVDTESAQRIVSEFNRRILQGEESTSAALLNVIEDYYGKNTKIFNKLRDKLLTNPFFGIPAYNLSQITKEMIDAKKRISSQADIIFGSSNFSSAEEAQQAELINKKYDALAETQENQIARIKELQVVYKNNANMMTQLDNELNKLIPKYEDWQKTINNIISGSSYAKVKNALTFMKDESFLDYVSRLRGNYSQLQKQIEDLASSSAPQNIKENIQAQIKGITTIFQALGLPLSDKSAGRKGTTKKIKWEFDLSDFEKQINKLVEQRQLTIEMQDLGDIKDSFYKSLEEFGIAVPIEISEEGFINALRELENKIKNLDIPKPKREDYALEDDYNEAIEKYKETEEERVKLTEQAEKEIFELKKKNAERIANEYDALIQKYALYEDKMREITRTAVKERGTFIENFGNKDQVKQFKELSKQYFTTDDEDVKRNILNSIKELVKIVAGDDQYKIALSFAIDNKEVDEKAALAIEEFKKSPYYKYGMGDKNSMSIGNIEQTITEYEKLLAIVKDSPTQIKEIQNAIRELQDEMVEKAPFETLISSFQKIKAARQDVSAKRTNLEEAKKIGNLENIKKAEENLYVSERKLEQQQEIQSKAMLASVDAVANLALGYEFLTDILGEAGKVGVEGAQSIAKATIAAINAVKTASNSVAILAIIQAAFTAIQAVSNLLDASEAKLNEQIEKLEGIFDRLEYWTNKFNDVDFTDINKIAALKQELKIRKQIYETRIIQTRKDIAALGGEYKKNMKEAISGVQGALLSGGSLEMALTQGIFRNNGSFSDALKNFFSGGIWGKGTLNVLTGGIFGFVKGIFNRKAIKNMKYGLELMNAELEHTAKITRIINSNMTDWQKAGAVEIANIEAEVANINNRIEKELSRKKKNIDWDKIFDLEDEKAELLEEKAAYWAESIKDNIGDIFNDLATSIADNLVDALSEGTSAAEAFDKSWDETITNMIKNLFRINYVLPRLKGFMSKLYQTIGLDEDGMPIDGVTPNLNNLTPEKMAMFKKEFENIGADAETLGEILQKFFKYAGIDLTSGNSSDLQTLQKGIQGVTETTAGVIEGYMGSIREQIFLRTAQMERLLINLDASLGNTSTQTMLLRESLSVQQNIYNILLNAMSASGLSLKVEMV